VTEQDPFDPDYLRIEADNFAAAQSEIRRKQMAAPTIHPGNVMTGGEFETEPEAWAAFDTMVGKSGAFRIHREVRGEYIQPRVDTELKTARIDRILIPLSKAVEAGWVHGAIGVEGKRSSVKIGRLVSQALDYSRCLFHLKHNPPGLLVGLSWVFLYPVDRITCDLESVMVNNRIGYAGISHRALQFNVSSTHVLTISNDGTVIARAELLMGKKRGSR